MVKNKIGYESTDKKIELNIYGLDFEIKNVSKLKDFEDVEDDDLNSLEKMLDIIFGEGSVKKINEKRVKDGYEEMDSTVALNILSLASGVYMEEYAGNIMQPLEKNMDRIDRINSYNSQVRKYNNRNYRNRGRYGRY